MLVYVAAFSLWVLPACDSDTKTKTNEDAISVNDVPEVVRTAFTAKYPGATDVKWEDATENNTKTYKAKFEVNGSKKKAEFGADGGFVKED